MLWSVVHADELGEEKPERDNTRSFTHAMKKECWERAREVPGRDPRRWRYDAVGNIVCRRLSGCHGCLCVQYDHIMPHSKGGKTVTSNCQLLQSRVNLFKGNKTNVTPHELHLNSCAMQFSERELDLIEMGVYGNVNRVGLKCKCDTVKEMQAALKNFKLL